MEDIETLLGATYAEEEHEAVRYGYLYRKRSEECDSSFHFCLPDASSALLWIASAVMSGIAYDVIKHTCKKIYTYLKGKRLKIDENTESILKNEESLEEFTVYIEEYHTHSMRITKKQEGYIKEEVYADYCAKEAKRFREKRGFDQDLSMEEYRKVVRYANKKAEELIHRVDDLNN